MSESIRKTEINPNSIPWWVKSIILLSVTGVVCYKLIITPFNLQFDFSTFLSLLLAIFSVALAAMFYFKATDTSNAFYDNTYKFSQEIAGLLVKIESGFGEKLTHLDDAYKGMRDRFDQFPGRLEIKDTKKELKQEEEELKKILDEKEKLIDKLVSKAHLREEEKEQFLKELRNKEEELNEAQQEMSFLKRRLIRGRDNEKRALRRNTLDHDMMNFFRGPVLSELGGPEYVLNRPIELISKKFRRFVSELPSEILNQLQKHKLTDDRGDLTKQGIEVLYEQAKAKTVM